MYSISSFFFGSIGIIFINAIHFLLLQDYAADAATITSFCLGAYHGCASFSDNKAKCWGWMIAFGQSSLFTENLGDTQSEVGDGLPYINVGTNIGVSQVSCGGQHTCFKLDTGNFKCVGTNGEGQIGLGITTSLIGSVSGHVGDSLPNVNVGTNLALLSIAPGQLHTCVNLSRKVKCYGNNQFAQLGYGDTSNRGTSPSQLGNNLAFVNLGAGVEVVSVHTSPNSRHNCVILSKPTSAAQRVKCWGFNNFSQLGYGDVNIRGDQSGEMGDFLPLVDFGKESRVKQISLSMFHTCALLFSDALKCYGRGLTGQLASGSSSDIKSTGTSLPSVWIDADKTISILTTGFNHTCIAYDDMKTMKCVGFNDKGQLGQGDKITRGATPTTRIPSVPKINLALRSFNISSVHSGQNTNCIVFTDSSIKCFGENINAQCLNGKQVNIGDNSEEMGNFLQFSQVFSPTKSPTIVPTKKPTARPTVIPTKNPTKSPTASPLPQRGAASICAGQAHTCITFGDKKMKCWGLKYSWGSSSSLFDFLGDMPSELGDNLPFVDLGTNLRVDQVSCGRYHTCFRFDAGNMKCLGYNANGQVGIGLTTNSIGAASGHVGNNLPNVNVGIGLQILDITLGSDSSCAVVTGGRVKCFGFNYYGRLGLGDAKDRGTSPKHMGDDLPFVNLGTGVEIDSIHASSSAGHFCVILLKPIASAHRLKCWGSNDFYQLGYGDKNNRGDAPNEMGDRLPLLNLGSESRVKQMALGYQHTCALLYSDALKCWGNGYSGQLGSGSTFTISIAGNLLPSVLIDSGRKISLLTTGYTHTCIVYNDMASMKCFGGNDVGQLGQGDKINRGDSPTRMIPSIPNIQLGTNIGKIYFIVSGGVHNCVIFNNYLVKCFGDNFYGELAVGSKQNIGDNVGEMGDYLQFSSIFSPTPSPTNSPSINPTPAPTTKIPTQVPSKKPTIAPGNICTSIIKELCLRDSRCKWIGRKCSPL